MGNVRGVRRDFEALEQRRLEGRGLLREGFNQSEVARRLKVCSQTVSRWAKAISERGEKGLKAAGRAGRKPLLDTKQRARLTSRLLEGPEKLGYETPLWTCPRVADLIEREFGIHYHAGHVWKLLRQLGWSPNGLWAGRWSAMKKPLANGSARPGRGLKKSPKRRAHHRLHRRKRAEPAATPVSHLGSARANPGPPVPLPLEDHFRGRRDDNLELLLPDLRQSCRQGRDDPLPGSSPSATEISSVSGVGPAACPPQPAGRRVPRFARRPDRRRIPSAFTRRNSIPSNISGATGNTASYPMSAPKTSGASMTGLVRHSGAYVADLI